MKPSVLCTGPLQPQCTITQLLVQDFCGSCSIHTVLSLVLSQTHSCWVIMTDLNDHSASPLLLKDYPFLHPNSSSVQKLSSRLQDMKKVAVLRMLPWTIGTIN